MPSGNSAILWILLAVEIAGIAVASYLGSRSMEPWAIRWKLWDFPSGRKDHEKPMLMTGGMLFLFAFLAAPVFFLASQSASVPLALVAAGALLAGGVGFADDWCKSRRKELGARWKLLAQCVAAGLAMGGGIRLRLLGDETANAVATLLWLVAVQNAWNFLDNMDGLATGLAATTALSFAAVFANLGAADLAVIAGALAGFCLGFLPRNFPKAQVFLGDAGTGCLGFAFGVLAVAGTYVAPGGPGLVAITIPLALLAIPLFDMAQVVVSRAIAREPVYRGDHRHISHRLAVKMGSRVRAVATLLVAGAVMGLLSLFVPHASTNLAWGLIGAQAAIFLSILLFALR